MLSSIVVVISGRIDLPQAEIRDKNGLFFFVDLDAFYVSVERLRHPEYREMPMAVYTGSLNGRGVIMTASYEARKYGVKSGMPIRQALYLCPGIMLVAAHPSLYEEYSNSVYSLLKGFSERIERVSIDENCLVVPSTIDPEATAKAIQATIRAKIGLPSSIGVGSNKLIAKMACDLAKPQGIRVIPPGYEKAFLAPLPVEKIPGVGPATLKIFHAMGIVTIDDLSKVDEQTLREKFGKRGAYFFNAAQGIDKTPLQLERRPRSLSREITFDRDIENFSILQSVLDSLSRDLADSLRKEKLVAKTVFLKLRYSDFSTNLRQFSLSSPTDDPTEIATCGLLLLKRNIKKEKALRLIGLGLRNLTAKTG
ncbi:DNA polymerase IV [Candidatus Methylacidiphilum infernorum]|uniref:DNA polymerase IV n=1 Tax=Candidatus Methylacidiphilum infernorum TaxID=511746 RepID=A0ABX7PTY1_9BACT|nr:DNA polymerase IV [Candidatus Methylacidiphilum infernorum]QSR86451.1 DNA polymerase IV [Candidatus Methylacidiphilum infernorum]